MSSACTPDLGQDATRFLDTLRAMPPGNWMGVLQEWNRLKADSRPWGSAIQGAEARALEDGLPYSKHHVEEAVFNGLHNRIQHVLAKEDPVTGAMTSIELLKAATIGTKAVMLRRFLQPEMFSLIYRPFRSYAPVRSAGSGCLVALLQL